MKLNEEQLLEIFNLIAIDCKPEALEIVNFDQTFVDIGLDSLDLVTFVIFLDDIWGLGDEEFNDHRFMDRTSIPTFGNFLTIIDEIGTNQDATYEDALESVVGDEF
jgi:acyl carrier protein